jgi:hypothetical protein
LQIAIAVFKRSKTCSASPFSCSYHAFSPPLYHRQRQRSLHISRGLMVKRRACGRSKKHSLTSANGRLKPKPQHGINHD